MRQSQPPLIKVQDKSVFLASSALEHKPRAVIADLEPVPSNINQQGQRMIHSCTWQWSWQLCPDWGSCVGINSDDDHATGPAAARGTSCVSIPHGGNSRSAPAPFFGVFWGFSPALLLLILVLWASGRFYEPPPNSSSGFLSRQDQQESISGHSDNKILWIQKSPSRLRNQPRPAEHPDFIQKLPDDVSTFPFTMYIA